MNEEQKITRLTPVETPDKVRFNANTINKVGMKYHQLLVLELVGRNKWSQILWKCQCDCGKQVIKVSGDLGRTKSCGCKHSSQDQRTGNHSPFWKGVGNISGYKLNKIKEGASRRGIAYELDDQYLWELYLQQDGKCALSGESINFGEKGSELGSASLDRIDSRKGYVVGNVQWLHRDVNIMKMDFSEEYFVALCSRVHYNNKLKNRSDNV